MKFGYLLFLIIISFCLTGCFLDPYQNSKFGEFSVDAWFSEETDDLGKTRLELEGIRKILKKECDYLENDSKNYVFKCRITYQPIGETVIPLSKDKILEVYTVFIPKANDEFDYIVYNSSSEEGIWTYDELLDYGG